METAYRHLVLSPLAPVTIVKPSYRELEYVLVIVAASEYGDLPCSFAIDTAVDVRANEVGYMDELTCLPVAQDTLQFFPAVWLQFSVLAKESEKVVNMTSHAVKYYQSLASVRPDDQLRRRVSEIRTRISHMPLKCRKQLACGP
jgi:hypothetical protein